MTTPVNNNQANWKTQRSQWLQDTFKTEPSRTTKLERIIEKGLIIFFFIIWMILLPVAGGMLFIFVNEFERAIIFRFGRLQGVRGPGLVFIIPGVDQIFKVDLRTETFDIAPQEILTKDSVTVMLDAVVYYRILDPVYTILQVENYKEATLMLSQTTLRKVAGQKILADLVSKRDEISSVIQRVLETSTHRWGVKVERVEVKDVRLPVNLQRAMASEAEAHREARAKIVAADGERAASLTLCEASDIISGNPTALQLRYLQTLSTISSERHSTTLFPFPIDIFTNTFEPREKPIGAIASKIQTSSYVRPSSLDDD